MSSINILTEIINIFEKEFIYQSTNTKNNINNNILPSQNKHDEQKELSWNCTILKDDTNTLLSMKDIKQLLITRAENKKHLKCKRLDLIKLLKSKHSVKLNQKYKNLNPKQLICELKLRNLCHKKAKKSVLIKRLNVINKNKHEEKEIDQLISKKKRKEIIPLRFINLINNNLISCSQCPTKQLIEYWYNEQHVSDIVSLIRNNEPNCYMINDLCAKLKINWHHFPISGAKKLTTKVEINFANWKKNNDAVNLWNVVECVVNIIKTEQNRNIVIHCAAGQHRTGLVMYLILRRLQFNQNETLHYIRNIRPITYTELVKDRNIKSKYKKTRKSWFKDKSFNKLTDFAEAFFSNINLH
eukprot:114233_1